jgi:anaerobic selenocysteine-containing dehydrogenase
VVGARGAGEGAVCWAATLVPQHLMERVVHRACPLCEACCGLRVTVEGDRVTGIRGDPEDPLSRGAICPKGVALADLHHDPERLRAPLRRTGSDWEPIGWTDALDLVASRLRAIQEAHGHDAVALYRGNPSSHNYELMIFQQEFVAALGSRNVYSAVSMDVLPHLLVASWMYGHQLLMPVPDLDRTRYMMILGGNPVVTQSSMMTAPGVARRIRDLKARGGRLVVVDPRRTETARLADQHVFVRPGTDALLLAAMLHVLFDEGLASPGRLAEFTDGLDAVEQAVRPWSPPRVESATCIPAATIESLARELASAESGLVYGRLGTSVQAHGVACNWLIQVLNLVTGNLDRPGGVMFSAPALDPMVLGIMPAWNLGRWTSRVRGLPEFGGELPVATLADELLTPGSGQVRALVTLAGNPVLSTPDGPRLERALDELDFVVSVDCYVNETSRHADLILPPASPLERDHYDLMWNQLAVRNVAKWSPRVFDPPPGALDDWQILSGLTRRLARGPQQRIAAFLRERIGPRRILGLGLRRGRSGVTLKRLEASEHGLDLGPLEPSLPGRLQTPDRRVAAAPPALLEDLSRLEALLDGRSPDGMDLLLIGRRELRSNNSWMHNLPRLVKGPARCTLIVHPEDARARGLSDGATARVRSSRGEVDVRVGVSDAIMRGVVSLPHGYGHRDRGLRLSVASRRPGVNANALTDPSKVDPVAGTAVLNGIPVSVLPVSASGTEET